MLAASPLTATDTIINLLLQGVSKNVSAYRGGEMKPQKIGGDCQVNSMSVCLYITIFFRLYVCDAR